MMDPGEPGGLDPLFTRLLDQGVWIVWDSRDNTFSFGKLHRVHLLNTNHIESSKIRCFMWYFDAFPG